MRRPGAGNRAPLAGLFLEPAVNNLFHVAALLLATIASTERALSEPAGYAKPAILIDETALARLLIDGERAVVVLDVRASADSSAGAVPKSQLVDLAAWKAAFDAGEGADAWGKRIGGLGIGERSTVVIYDSAITPKATRLWWLLKYWGVADVRVLDGGYAVWAATGLAGQGTPPAPVAFEARPQPERLADRAAVQLALAAGSAEAPCVVDARSGREFAAGAIATARNSDWRRYVDPATGKMRPAADVKALLAAAGFQPGRSTITYCRSGGRSSFVAFVMELVGGEPVANYWGSYPDWTAGGDPSPSASPDSEAPIDDRGGPH